MTVHTAPGTGRATAVGPAARPAVAVAPVQAHDPVSDTTRLLLRLIAAGQERERQHLCDAFHDGPIQDLTAVLLTCAAVRRTLDGPAAEKLAAVETQLRDAITTLQLPAPAFRAGSDASKILTTALTNRVRGTLARELETVLDVDEAPPSRAEIAEVLSAVQLLLLESDPWRPARRASVTVRSGPDGVTLTLCASPDPCSATSLDAAHDAVARAGRLRRVAAIVGARITEEQPGGSWRASLSWPRRTPPPITQGRLDVPRPS
ncbi:histidine kinase [Pseudofrankia inefficax]|uniref:Putative two-component sensor n=1 Tax=Pseudofrankia inefficax (strain DSM 45817 / CECT 9037 / DDB 130130 / EuI1c) TaxID=298654 RepID=E3JCB1_PSEI1|nr:histidine kinase [Pseudofrankia inefficax]ADP84700.1 putative two-component sensor [Pseudofrankia inefficax]